MSEPYVGARREIAFSLESVRGTRVAPSAGDWQPHMDHTIRPIIEKYKDMPASGNIAELSNSALLRSHLEGDVPLRLTKDFIGDAINMALGKTPDTTGSAPNYTHDWDNFANTNAPVSYSVTCLDPVAGTFAGTQGTPTGMTFDFNRDSAAMLTLNAFKATYSGNVTVDAPAYATDFEYPFFMPQHLKVKDAADVAGLTGATAYDIASGQLQIEKNTEVHFDHGNLSATRIIPQRMAIGGSLTSVYVSTKFRDYAHANTKRALQFIFDDGDGSELTITLPKVGFEDWNDNASSDAYIQDSVVFFAENHLTNGLINVELKNKIASYS